MLENGRQRQKKKTQEVTPQDITPENQITADRSTRLKEAKKWVTIAKTHVDDSRNLKTEYKKGIIQAIDNLYTIIKMREEERKTVGENENQIRTANVEPILQLDIKELAREVSSHIQNNDSEIIQLITNIKQNIEVIHEK